MPLNTEISRDGKAIDMIWDYTGLSIMYSVAVAEAAPDTPINEEITFGEAAEAGKYMDWSMMPIYYMGDDPKFGKVPLIRDGRQVLENDYTFTQHRYPDGPDGEPEDFILELKAGDVLRAFRD